jgi:hypothetical protein
MRGGGEIRRVDDGDGFAGRIPRSQQRPEQMVIDGAELHGIQTIAKLMQHLGVGQDAFVGQSSEVSPEAVLGQELHEEVERMHGRQKVEQQDSKQLRGPKQRTSAPASWTWEEVVDGFIGQIGRERLQERGGAGLRERIHRRKLPPANSLRLGGNQITVFSGLSAIASAA